MDTKRLLELARGVEMAKGNFAYEEERYLKAKAEYEKAQGILDVKQQELTDFLNGAASE